MFVRGQAGVREQGTPVGHFIKSREEVRPPLTVTLRPVTPGLSHPVTHTLISGHTLRRGVSPNRPHSHTVKRIHTPMHARRQAGKHQTTHIHTLCSTHIHTHTHIHSTRANMRAHSPVHPLSSAHTHTHITRTWTHAGRRRIHTHTHARAHAGRQVWTTDTQHDTCGSTIQ